MLALEQRGIKVSRSTVGIGNKSDEERKPAA